MERSLRFLLSQRDHFPGDLLNDVDTEITAGAHERPSSLSLPASAPTA